MNIDESENELRKVRQKSDEALLSYRKAYELDYKELKWLTTERFGNSEMDDVITQLITNSLTEVVSLAEPEANGEQVDHYPIILFGVMSLLELSDKNPLNLLREHLFNLSEKYSSDSFGRTISKIFSNAKNKFKLLFYERKNYATPELSYFLLMNLTDSIKNVENEDYFIFISKIFKATKRNDENKSTIIIHLHTEDSKFAEQATDSFEYPVDSRIVSEFPKWGCPFAPNIWNSDDFTNAEPWRIIYLIKLNKLEIISQNLKDQFQL